MGKTEFFEGSEALAEVAKPEGLWNWCLIAPDPKRLPLVAGGFGGVEAMKDAIGEHATSYGLVRMSFGTGTTILHRWIKVDASDEETNTAKGISAVAKGKAAAKAPEMAAAFKTYSSATLSVTIQHKEECTPDHFLKALIQGGTADKDRLTMKENQAAMAEFAEKFPSVGEDSADSKAEKEAEAEAAAMVQGEQNVAVLEEEPIEADKDGGDAAADGAAPPGGDPAWAPALNEPIQCWSAGAKIWFDDGFVVDTLTKDGEKDGLKLQAGAIKVLYDSNKRLKWITPQNIVYWVRKSDRPAPPKSLKGGMLKETHNFISQWHERHFQLIKGFLTWWVKEEEADAGKKPSGCMSMHGMSLRTNGNVILLKSSSTKGVIYQFDCQSAESRDKWMKYIEMHAKYVSDLNHFHSQQKKAKAGDKSPSKGDKSPSAKKA